MKLSLSIRSSINQMGYGCRLKRRKRSAQLRTMSESNVQNGDSYGEAGSEADNNAERRQLHQSLGSEYSSGEEEPKRRILMTTKTLRRTRPRMNAKATIPKGSGESASVSVKSWLKKKP